MAAESLGVAGGGGTEGLRGPEHMTAAQVEERPSFVTKILAFSLHTILFFFQ
jgi:hypothetical protein